MPRRVNCHLFWEYALVGDVSIRMPSLLLQALIQAIYLLYRAASIAS
jgi:hypothetical protein